MQAGGINDVPDFLTKSIGNPIKPDFQSLDDVLLAGKDLAFLPPSQFAFLPTFLP